MSTSDCNLLVSQLRAAWIEWLYLKDDDKKSKIEHDIAILEYKIMLNCNDVSDILQEVHSELKRLPIPDWLK